MSEQWKDIPGFEGRYQVSDLGRVRSVDHRVRLVVHGIETTRKVPGRVLRPGPVGDLGHLSVALGKGNSQAVHALVALAFIGPRPAGLDVAHWDGDASNNAVSNLRYATRASNNQDMTRHGKHRLSESEVRRIRIEARKYHGAGRDLALSLGVSQATISAVLTGRHYSHVE